MTPEDKREYQKQWFKKHPNARKIYKHRDRLKNHKYYADYKKNNTEKISEYNKNYCRTYYKNNKEMLLQNMKQHYQQNRTNKLDVSKIYRHNNPDKIAEDKLQRAYGIGLKEYEALLKAQNGLCAICQKSPSEKGTNKKLGVDHNHKTKKVRELLCHKCNFALGLVNESIEILTSMAAYLIKHNKTDKVC